MARAVHVDGGDVDPKSRIDRWIGKPDPSPELTSALDDLRRLGGSRPELTEAARELGRLLVAAFNGAGRTPATIRDLEPVRAGWLAGRPAFQVSPPQLDRSTLITRLRRIGRVFGRENEPIRMVSRAIRSRRAELMDWVDMALAGRAEDLAVEAGRISLDPSAVASVLRLTLLPSLSILSAGLQSSRAEGAWSRGDCPNCGSRPLLAESRGLEQRIHYRCGLCAGDWPGERLGCASCGEVSSRALHYSYVDGEQDRYRLGHCDTCLYDWKVVSTLTALSPPAMIVADLATIHLDLLAVARRGDAS